MGHQNTSAAGFKIATRRKDPELRGKHAESSNIINTKFVPTPTMNIALPSQGA